MRSLLLLPFILFSLDTLARCQALTVETAKRIGSTLNIEIELKNETSRELLLVSPNFGDTGPARYFLGFDNGSRTLQIRRQFFEYPHAYITDLEEPCMILKRLKPDDTYKEVFSLSYPLAENDYILPAKIDIGKYSLVQVYIGIMPFDEGIYKIHDRRPFGHCVMYDDLVSDGPFKGKKLIDIQEIVESKSTEIRRQ